MGQRPSFTRKSGWRDLARESRTDLAQLCGSLFLLIAGADALDARLAHANSVTPAKATVRD
ncbi:hypothetical protein ACQ9ZG_22130 [Streptomyces araujoniae]|uniref:hypothetical protein n=1 Tax=Streptomyces sp. ZEA17I TaxID=2202516 RepID=UPI001C643D62|nr:hypothetical protein [Streptomyces sp. ZEA17I]